MPEARSVTLATLFPDLRDKPSSANARWTLGELLLIFAFVGRSVACM